MSNIIITRYAEDHPLPEPVAEQVAQLFASEYPVSHAENDRQRDVSRRATGAAILQLMATEGRTIYVAQDEDEAEATISGFLESSISDQLGGTYEQLVWIMTDREQRGRHIASLLHRSFIIDATLRAMERAPHPTAALLTVHSENPAQAVYERWGYTTVSDAGNGKRFMSKPLPHQE